MKIHYLQHVPFEGIAYIGEWAKLNHCQVTGTAIYKNESFPAPDNFDCLVVMGGPMGVYDESIHSWLKPEKKFIDQAIAAGKKVIGICLGAQLLAEVLGARVFKNKWKEIGWYPVAKMESARLSAIDPVLPREFYAFHWHGDTFDIPHGALHLAESKACAHQAFIYQEKVLGLQFHLESSRSSIESLIENCAAEIAPESYIQGTETIRSQYGLIGQSNARMTDILNFLIKKEK